MVTGFDVLTLWFAFGLHESVFELVADVFALFQYNAPLLRGVLLEVVPVCYFEV